MVRIISLKFYTSKVQCLSENLPVFKLERAVSIQRQCRTCIRHPNFPGDMFFRELFLDIKRVQQKLNLYMPKYRKDSHPMSMTLGRRSPVFSLKEYLTWTSEGSSRGEAKPPEIEKQACRNHTSVQRTRSHWRKEFWGVECQQKVCFSLLFSTEWNNWSWTSEMIAFHLEIQPSFGFSLKTLQAQTGSFALSGGECLTTAQKWKVSKIHQSLLPVASSWTGMHFRRILLSTLLPGSA